MSVPNSQVPDLDTLPPAVREAFLVLQAEVAGLRTQTERQDYLIAELRHALCGKRSEQPDPDDRQLAFEDLETAVAEAEAANDASVAPNADGSPKRPAAKRNLGHLPDHLPRIEQVIEPRHKVCPCGCTDMVKIGEDRSERLDIIPARFQVIVTLERRSGLARMNSSGGRIQGDQGPEGRPDMPAAVAMAVCCKASHCAPLVQEQWRAPRPG